MKNYIIVFKNGKKLRVIEDVAFGIISMKGIGGYHTVCVSTDKKPDYKQLICLSEILYIQPEELEITDGAFTYTPTITPMISDSTTGTREAINQNTIN